MWQEFALHVVHHYDIFHYVILSTAAWWHIVTQFNRLRWAEPSINKTICIYVHTLFTEFKDLLRGRNMTKMIHAYLAVRDILWFVIYPQCLRRLIVKRPRHVHIFTCQRLSDIDRWNCPSDDPDMYILSLIGGCQCLTELIVRCVRHVHTFTYKRLGVWEMGIIVRYPQNVHTVAYKRLSVSDRRS